MDFPGKNPGVGSHFLLQGTFPTQRSNPYLLLGRRILYHWGAWEAVYIHIHGLQRVRHDWTTFTHTLARAHTHTHKEVYCEELAHEITEAEQSHSLLSLGWRPRKASWYDSIWSRKTWEPEVPRAEGDRHPALNSQAGNARFFLCLLVPFWGAVLIGCREGNGTPLHLPGKSHGWRSLVGCSPWGRKESDMTERLHFHFSLSCIGEGNGNPLQCSCLENPRDGGAWWAAVYRVARSWTRLKWLSSSSQHWLVDAQPHWEGKLLYWVHWFKC